MSAVRFDFEGSHTSAAIPVRAPVLGGPARRFDFEGSHHATAAPVRVPVPGGPSRRFDFEGWLPVRKAGK